MTFDALLKKYRASAFSERDKGDRFENLMVAYLQTDPKYAERFKSVWLWRDFPARQDFGGKDTGIDLVALTHEGDYWAIQCKCFSEDATVDKKAVDSFLSTSSRTFKNDQSQTVSFAHRLWISTTNKWGGNAEEAIRNQDPPVSRINLYDLQQAPVDWEKLQKGIVGELARISKKVLKPHQTDAVESTHEHFQSADRGKLIMACGTGKTFTSLRIAEKETDGKGLVLFLVPSIALLGQTLAEWFADAEEPINPVCICSDPQVSKRKSNDDADSFSVVDLALPASTDARTIVKQLHHVHTKKKSGMTVVFSTYQSIDVIAKAQKQLLKEEKELGIFDLIICDEAHRTTGVALTKEDSTSFIKVHDDDFLRAKKRLYMTATPRLYSDDSKAKAAQSDAILCSMDDPEIYGEEIYRIGFGEAVERDLLSDYKVLILTLSEKDIPKAIQNIISDKEQEINTDDASKLIGCINALSKQILGDEGIIESTDPDPMQRAVAFCQSIKVSKKITETFNEVTEMYLDSLTKHKRAKMVEVESQHVDGTMSAPQRDALMGWLKSSDADESTCRILTNVRCLSEGVDVPSLDAVLFLSAKNSQVDVVQSVGRVMRKAPGKKYGYIVIPVVVPADKDPSEALNDNERYKIVWSVLNALRAHDDRFNATINKIDLNKKKPEQILVGRVGGDEEVEGRGDDLDDTKGLSSVAQQLNLQFEELQSLMFARMVQKVGDRRYWEQWAKNVAEIAERQIERITKLVNEDGDHKKAFAEFLEGLQKNINPAITEREAIEMLSQHIITKPVFEALFENYSFVKNNPISVSMQKMLDVLEAQVIENDVETLDKFYESVRKRAAGIDNAEGKQKIIIELYDKFFKTAFPKMAEQLGIVYTPVEVVDFIIHSVDDILKKEFDRSLTDENIHILDPFTGTGTFISRLLQSGLVKKEDLVRKYRKELHANEIVLLAYYIAAVNIENVFHDLTSNSEKYEEFNGICLTDTFQLSESDENDKLFSDMFPQNSERVVAQKKTPIRVIIGNPPYSGGQKSENDNAKNREYPVLDQKIADTYVVESGTSMNKALYDPYVKAFRWSTDRIDKNHGGIIGFISSGSWLDGVAASGFRKCIHKEFSSIYVLNLRGNQRTSGEESRKEGGKIFGSGSRAPITITILVYNPKKKTGADIFYHDIGDYLSRDEKLNMLKSFCSIRSKDLEWEVLTPNSHGDWLKQRKDKYQTFVVLADKKKNESSFFAQNSNGLFTSRDSWVYNYSAQSLEKNMQSMIAFYNDQITGYFKQIKTKPNIVVEDYIDTNPQKISWSRAVKNSLKHGTKRNYDATSMVIGMYRPFTKMHCYFNRDFNECVYQQPKLFPDANCTNNVICTSGTGGNKDFTAIMSSLIPDLNFLDAGAQCFPLYYYEERKKQSPSLFDAAGESEYIRRDGISDFIYEQAKKIYSSRVTKEDIFYYVYGILHSPEYRKEFANDLKKMLPRLPLVDEPNVFWKFSKAGRELAELHVNYESFEPNQNVKVEGAESKYYKVEKMRFPAKDKKDTIIFNSKIMISNIPEEAYDYVVNGKSAIEWIMERYQVTVNKDSGIKNDPNDWAEEVGNPRYILDLLLSVINVSVKTVEIVKGLPKLKF